MINKNDAEPFHDCDLERPYKTSKKDRKDNILKLFENTLKNVLECHVKIEKVEKKVEKGCRDSGVVVASTVTTYVYYINYKKSVKITHIFFCSFYYSCNLKY
jgi:hypothetical protein